MAYVMENRKLSGDFFLLRVAGTEKPGEAKMGQFCMLHTWDTYPLLSRPISIFDRDDESLTFLCKIADEGMRLLAGLCVGDEIETGHVLGNSFPFVSGRIALVGGGAGIAPLHLAAKTLKAQGDATIDTYLGFDNRAMLMSEYARHSDSLIVNVGGFIADRIDTSAYDCVFACGPEDMMRALYGKCKKTGTKLYASLGSKMACDTGACLGCACETTERRGKICEDGPIFAAEFRYYGRDQGNYLDNPL